MQGNLVLNDQERLKKENDSKFRVKAGVFLATVAGASAVLGFGTTVASAKKSDPQYFSKGVIGSREMREPGTTLALRALGWGTLYAVTGCGVLFYLIWKMSGAENLQDFRRRAGNILPKVPKNDPPQSRTEFSGLNDFLDYVQTLKSKDSK